MAKMFYTMDEAAERLKMDASEVQGLVESGQLQEFRDGDRLMFKVDQVDLLAGGDEGGGDLISLSDSTAGDLGGSGSIGIGLDESDSPVETAGGISIFDADGDADTDPSAATQITDKPMAAMDFSFDSAASGSGLADLALEQDDTSLGQDVLQDVYGEGDGSEAGGSAVTGSEFGLPADAGGGDLFESAPAAAAAPVASPGVGVPGAALPEAYDGTWSGISAGIAIGMVVAVLAALVFVIGGLAGASPDVLLGAADQMTVYIVLGAAAGVMLIGAVLGFVMMRKS